MTTTQHSTHESSPGAADVVSTPAAPGAVSTPVTGRYLGGQEGREAMIPTQATAPGGLVAPLDDAACNSALDDVYLERCRQHNRFGQQAHRDGTGRPVDRNLADQARARCEAAAATGDLSWRDVLSEEVAEAYAESDWYALRSELVQVAAVATAWVEAIDRRGGDPR